MAAGIAPEHCEIHRDGTGASVHVRNAANSVALNGKPVTETVGFKSGDILVFGKIGSRVVTVEKPTTLPPVSRPPAASEPDDGRTRVRQAMPKFILRGVSGSTFGKNFALQGTMTIGRQPDCDICIPSDEVSRRHAKLQVMPDGIAVEDIGSANGTFIADKRVHTGMLKPGDELRLDTVRFLLVAPHLESARVAATTTTAAATVSASGSSSMKWLIIGVIAIAAIAGLIASGIIQL
jgi:pSer/pThr/pTyr-binding forkhead associated (FHA) protein